MALGMQQPRQAIQSAARAPSWRSLQVYAKRCRKLRWTLSVLPVNLLTNRHYTRPPSDAAEERASPPEILSRKKNGRERPPVLPTSACTVQILAHTALVCV